MTLPVSGPGAYSQRTDRQPIRNPGGLPYGQNQALQQIQQAAPMQAAQPLPPVTPIHAPSERPGEPITAGVDRGPGPGSEALTARPGRPAGSPLIQAIAEAAAGDPSGTLASLYVEALKRGM